MKTAMILRGLPGSGKSSFARELMKREPGRFTRTNRDDLRNMLHSGVFSRDNEEVVKSLQDHVILSTLRAGQDVIVDNTHLVSQTVKKLHRLAESVGDVTVMEKCFNVDVTECLARNALREGIARVPDKVIIDMARAAGLDKGRKLEDRQVYYQPRQFSLVRQDASLPRAIMCDLDGTLALLNGRNPYDVSTCDDDLPNVPVIECVLAMHTKGHRVIFMSGREDKHREPTVRFIEKHCRRRIVYAFSDVPVSRPTTECIPYELHMRPTGDQRKDSIIKRELFEANVLGKYYVEFILDDRDQVVAGWREMGLTTFQVAEGAF